MALSHFGKMGLFRDRLPGLLGVVAVVEPDADELAGVGDGRVQAGRAAGQGDGLRDAAHRFLRCRAPLQELASGQRHQDGRDLVGSDHALSGQRGGDAGLEVDDPVAVQPAQAGRLAIGGEPNELHVSALR